MKYIVTKDQGDLELIWLFDRTINHDVFAEAVSSLRNQTHGEWTRVKRTVISAGFVDTISGACYGESITLNLQSRPTQDSKLLRMQGLSC